MTLDRRSPFSYRCGGCGRCCVGRRVPLTPYEVLRLARRTGVSTTELLRRCTVEEGAALAHVGKTRRCVFLDGVRCTVHEDRPLACRLYPLGRLEVTAPRATETFHLLEPEPASAGTYGDDGTIDDFLASQDVEPFLAARALYAELLEEIEAELARAEVEDRVLQALPADLLDVDAVVAEHCRRRGEAPPDDAWELTKTHVAAVREMLGSVPPGARTG